ncbi:nuclease-related domain-containing protein [Nostocoides sp. F2B08]|uniref:nuclease-related domain-containing protein n=1 Tax=Nostocoides sp. F2B08 TaxID=2653936 RepID=UPI00186B2107|nr:nuclease-related domain-containing protein [Tetrasphaera sp. F2B08]
MTGESARRKAESLAAAGDPDAAKWLAGARGEQRVAEALATLPAAWTVTHDRLLLPGMAESNIDHLIIGPPGVVMVDAKNFSGDITVWNDSLFQHLGGGEHRTSRNLVRELRKVHWMAVQVSTRLRVPVTPVLCLAGDRPNRFGEPQLVCGVWVLAHSSLVGWLRSLPARISDDGIRRLVPRVLSEFPSTMTDPELLAAIGRDLARTSAADGEQRALISPSGQCQSARRRKDGHPRRRGGHRSLKRLLRFALVGGLLIWGSQYISVVSGHVATLVTSVLVGGLSPGGHASDSSASLARSVEGRPPVLGGLDCQALSPERLSSYVKVDVAPLHGEDGTCRWLADPQDPATVVMTAEQLEPHSVAHLPGDLVSLTASASLAPPGPTSILLGRPGQWIPVADNRTETQWPIRLEIYRGQLGIDDHRGQQILRAAAADLNGAAQGQ